MFKIILISTLICLPAWAQEKVTTINWWHAMNGSRNDIVKEMVKRYNDSQNKFKVKASEKGNYTETLNSSIAAFRAKKQPHLVQVFEVGTMTMMQSKVIYPVHQLFKDYKVAVDWSNYLQPVLSYYMTNDNKLLSMPFNSSTPIMYYNKNLLAKAGLKTPPKTWTELEQHTLKLKEAGVKCSLTSSWQSWILIENYSAIHNIPFASQGNGFASLTAKLNVDNEKVVNHIERLHRWAKDGRFSYQGRRGGPALNAFTAGKCALLFESSSGLSSVEKLAKFDWSAAPLPFEEGTKPLNSIIGGATLWVFKGHTKKEYEAVADFLRFLSTKEMQTWWHKKTGYLPITLDAYESLKKDGFYKKYPYQEVAIKQLTRATPNQATSRGIRLGSFTQIRDVINEELEKVWNNNISAKEAMANIVKRGNILLKNFHRRNR